MTNNDLSQQDINQIDDRITEDTKKLITEHLQVKDVNGEHVGTVDHLDGDQIKLTKSDSHDGQHHFVSLDDVASVDEVAVYLNKSTADLNLS